MNWRKKQTRRWHVTISCQSDGRPSQPVRRWKSGSVHLAEGSNVVLEQKYILSNSESVQCNFFIFWSRHKNLMILHWDMAIYRFSKWRSSAILELFYHHTRPPTKSLSNFMSIWCTVWIFRIIIWLEMPIQFPKIGVLGDFGPLTVIIHHRDPQKTNPCVNPRF